MTDTIGHALRDLRLLRNVVGGLDWSLTARGHQAYFVDLDKAIRAIEKAHAEGDHETALFNLNLAHALVPVIYAQHAIDRQE